MSTLRNGHAILVMTRGAGNLLRLRGAEARAVAPVPAGCLLSRRRVRLRLKREETGRGEGHRLTQPPPLPLGFPGRRGLSREAPQRPLEGEKREDSRDFSLLRPFAIFFFLF